MGPVAGIEVVEEVATVERIAGVAEKTPVTYTPSCRDLSFMPDVWSNGDNRRTLLQAAVVVALLTVVLVFVFQSQLMSLAATVLYTFVDAPGSTCTPTDTEMSDEWTEWESQGDLPFGLYDPVMFVEPDREYPYRVLVAPDNRKMDLYRSQDMREFERVATDLEGDQFASNFNWGRKVDGRYYLFRTLRENETELWTGDSLTNLTNRGVVLEEADTGGFYDAETETWHIYYQKASESADDGDFGPNTDRFVHATSTDAVNWTRQGVALDVSDEPWKAGDPDVIKIDDRYYMFFDQTENHPNYHIHLAVSNNLSRFEPVGRVTETCGGDAKVRYLPTRGEFIMLTEFGGEDISNIGVQTSRGPRNASYRLDGRQDVIRTEGNGTE